MKKIFLLTTLVYCCLLFCNAQSGEPDSSYGINGSVKTNFKSLPQPTQYNSISVQPDGKIIAAGFTQNETFNSLALARYNPGGTLDKSFSGDGKVTTDSFTCTVMAIQKDGKILVAGSSLARYNADGSIDSTFSHDGKATEFSDISAIAVQPDGKIIVAGEGNQLSPIGRYNTDGTIDTTFSIGPNSTTGEIKSILIQDDGKIITVGFIVVDDKTDQLFYALLARFTPGGKPDSTFNGTGSVNYFFDDLQKLSKATLQNDKIVVGVVANGATALLRFNNDGSIDDTFGSDGLAQGAFLGIDNFPLIIESDGKIIIGSSTFNSTSFDFALARFTMEGIPDNSFGNDGTIRTKISDQYDAVLGLALSGTTLYAAGSGPAPGVIAAYRLNGKTDSSFGSNGIVETNFGTGRGSTNYGATALQSDGKLLAVGSSNNGSTTSFAIARYNTDGSLDSKFSRDGEQTTGFGSDQSSSASSVAIGNNGKIVVAGSTTGADGNPSFAVARYNIDGSPDSTFNGSGKEILNFGDAFSYASSVAVQPDGKMIVAGVTGTTTQFTYFALARLNTNGSLDSSFNGNGKQITDVEKYSNAYSVVLKKNGQIIVAGSCSGEGIDYHIAIARYNIDGSLDRTFNGTGIQKAQEGGTLGSSCLALQSDGKILVAGYSSDFSGAYFTVFRYDSNGTVDNSFDKDGKKQAFKVGRESYEFATAISIAVQNDKKILAAGYRGGNTPIFARFNPNGSLDTSFSTDGMTQFAFTGGSAGGLAISGNKFYYVSSTGDNFGLVSRYFLDNKTVTPPIVNITSPVSGTNFITPGPICLTAVAIDSFAKIKSVDFYTDSTLLFSDSIAPYTRLWQSVSPGSYYITAVATNSNGLKQTSAPVHITVLHNRPPLVNITSPGDSTTYTAPATITLSANAVAHGGKIKTVKFYSGKTLIHTEENPPYLWTWTNLPAGNYTLTAVATDSYDRTATSAPVTITVRPTGALLISSNSPSSNIKNGLDNFVSMQLAPNPAHTILNIHTTGLQQNRQLTISVISSSGVILKTMQGGCSTSAIPINVSSLESGMYIIKIISGDKVIYRQFVKR